MLNFKEWIKVWTVDWLNEKPGRKTGLGVFDFEWKPRNPNHRARQNNTIWLFSLMALQLTMNYIMTSSSLLTRYQGTPSQDKGIRSSSQDQCTAHNATIVLPHLHHNCQNRKAYQQRIHNIPSYHKALGKICSLVKLFIDNPKHLVTKKLVKQQ